MTRLTLQAPAKINLYLEVRGRRPDGFHELVTVLQTIDLCDTLTVLRRERRSDLAPGVPDVDLTLVGEQPDVAGSVPTGADNLAVRAAASVLTQAGLCDETGLSIQLEKAIPAGGGLGGGSSDAAAAACATNTLVGSPCDHASLSALCAGLGSDVPFFLTGGTALCTGRGELVRPLQPTADFEATLLLPDFGVPTPAVYRALDAPALDEQRRRDTDTAAAGLAVLESALAGADARELDRIYRNDLEAPALRVAPALGRLLDDPHLHLSGSGSTVFAYGPADPSLLERLASSSIRFVEIRSRNR